MHIQTKGKNTNQTVKSSVDYKYYLYIHCHLNTLYKFSYCQPNVLRWSQYFINTINFLNTATLTETHDVHPIFMSQIIWTETNHPYTSVKFN